MEKQVNKYTVLQEDGNFFMIDSKLIYPELINNIIKSNLKVSRVEQWFNNKWTLVFKK